MTVKSALTAALRGHRRDTPAPAAATTPDVRIDPSAMQIFAHGLIAELFGAGLRLQNLRGHVSEEIRLDLEQIADQIDNAIHELRAFAFTHTAPGNGKDASASAGTD